MMKSGNSLAFMPVDAAAADKYDASHVVDLWDICMVRALMSIYIAGYEV